MNIGQAIGYPFKKGNIVPMLVIPSVLCLLSVILLAAPVAAAFLMSVGQLPAAFNFTEQTQLSDLVAQIPLTSLYMLLGALASGLVLSLCVSLPIYGYFWEVQRVLFYDGPNVPGPTWKGKTKYYFNAGLHFFLACLIMAIPTMLLTMPLGLGLPFCVMPFCVASKDKTLPAVFKSLPRGFSLAAKNYVPLLIAMVVSVVLSIVYNFVAGFALITLIGYPMICFAGAITAICLLAQQCPLDVHKPAPLTKEEAAAKAELADAQLVDTSKRTGPPPSVLFSPQETQSLAPQEQTPIIAYNETIPTAQPISTEPKMYEEGDLPPANPGDIDPAAQEGTMVLHTPVNQQKKSDEEKNKPLSKQKLASLSKGDNPWLKNRTNV